MSEVKVILLEELIWTYGIIKRREYLEKLLTPPKMISAKEWAKKN
jgi:hypothetical protein